jgi:hypothetical protein
MPKPQFSGLYRHEKRARGFRGQLAERQMGEFLKRMPKATGAKGVGPIAVPDRNRNEPATLAEIGITKKQSATAQKLADIPRRLTRRALIECPQHPQPISTPRRSITARSD